MFSKNELYKTKAKIASLENNFGGSVIVKNGDGIEGAENDLVKFDSGATPQNRYVTTAEKTWKHEMDSGKLHFEFHGNQEIPKIFKEESFDESKAAPHQPKEPKKKKIKFCCF